MRTRTPSLISLGGLFLALAAAVITGFLVLGSPALAASQDAPTAQVTINGTPVTTLPATTCNWDAPRSVRVCDLWAMTGTITMPTGTELPVWGFAITDTGPAQVPGPVLIANASETLEVVLHNQLDGETVSLAFPGQGDPDLIPDLVGVGTGQKVTYTFTVSDPGTFLYEAGLTDRHAATLTVAGPRQVAMGLYGALVVRPVTPTQAYDDASTAFDDEVVLVLSEIDPLFNPAPNAFPFHEFSPRYWLINGKAYPETAVIDTRAGNTILLRYVNAGLKSHWMGLLGLEQQIIGSDGKPRALPQRAVVETIAGGQTVDALVMVPSAAVSETVYALYDANMMLHNASDRSTPDAPVDFGGMMTFIRIVSGTAQYEDGPVATASVDPDNTTGANGVTLTVRLDDTANGGDNVNLAEYFVDIVGAPSTGITQSVGPATVATATWIIDALTLDAWSSGSHELYARGRDGVPNWGFVGSAVLNLDKTGPLVHGMSLSPEPTNGAYDVLLRATGDDHGVGANNVISGTYSLDGGPALPMSLNRIDAPIVAMTATLPSAVLTVTPEGLITIAVMAQDSLLNWGVPSVITLTLDKTGPYAPVVTLTPSLVNFASGPGVTHVRLDAALSDALSNGVQTTLANAEAFVDAVGPGGTGFDLFPSDGLFDEVSEAAYFDIPVANFAALAAGDHTVYVRGLDEAGNWGTLGSATITVQQASGFGPVISDLAVSPNPTGGAAQATLTGTATQVTGTVDAAQYWVDAGPWIAMDPADGAFDSGIEGLTALVDVSTMKNGLHTIWVRASSGGIWGIAATIQVRVSGNPANQIMANSFEAGLAGWTGGAVGQVDTGTQAALAPDGGTLGMMATLGATAPASADAVSPAYVSHIMPAGEASYRVTFYWDPNGTDFGSGHPDILLGLDKDTPIFGIRAEESGSGVDYEIQGWVLVNGVVESTDWYDVSDAPHKLGLEWRAGAGTVLSLAVDDDVVEELTSGDTQDRTLYETHLGPSGNLDLSASGVQYFDGFIAMRLVNAWLPEIWR